MKSETLQLVEQLPVLRSVFIVERSANFTTSLLSLGLWVLFFVAFVYVFCVCLLDVIFGWPTRFK